MKKLILFAMNILFAASAFAQKQTYDIVSYTAPKDWTEKQGGGNISYSRIDGGSWAQIAIYQHRSSEGDIQADFDKDWNELVTPGRTVSAPEKTEPQTSDGFTVMSGSGVWQYNGTNVASMLTVYSNQKICIALLCNTTAMPYLKEYQNFIGSLDINVGNDVETAVSESNPSSEPNPSTTNTTTADVNSVSIVGLWIDYMLETTGYNINGMPQYTAGYLRKEYSFNADGTYVFRNKQWLTKTKDILFMYESGTYKVNGNQLTITPQTGKSGFWGKLARTTEWGKMVKMNDYKLEKTTYSFEIKYFSASDSYSLNLNAGAPTQRDGGQFNSANDPYEFHYNLRKLETLIDNPPGWSPR
ncbi:MAG: lipocalin family protein [Ferruginibacter sp.]